MAEKFNIDISGLSVPTIGFTRNVIYSKDIEVVILCWAKDVSFPLHYHQDSAVYTKILHGKIEEKLLIPNDNGYNGSRVVFTKGQDFYLPPYSYHALSSIEPTIMLNIYSPPISHKDQQISEQLEQELYRKYFNNESQKTCETIQEFVSPG